MKGYNALIERVKTVNDELRDMGLEWDEVESFWNHCFRIARERKEAEQLNAKKGNCPTDCHQNKSGSKSTPSGRK